jgi:hypothetical protein
MPKSEKEVKAVMSFVGTDASGKKWRVSARQQFILPDGVDWLDKGLVTLVQRDQKPVVKKQRSKK